MVKPESKQQGERALVDPVIKVLFEQDRDGLLGLMLGAPVSVLQVLDPVLPAGEQSSDGVLLVKDQANEEFVLHVEFMTRVEQNMGERIFGYVPRIFRKYRKSVRSVVLYFIQPGPKTQIETEFRMVVQGREVSVTRFDVVCLWEIEPNRALLADHPALLALAPLMKGAQVTELEGWAELATKGPWDEGTKRDVVTLQAIFGAQLFGRDVVFSIVRRLGMLKDIVEDSPFYELAREFGEKRGKAEGLRDACLEVTEAKAPRLVPVLEKHLSDTADDALLRKLLRDLSLAQDKEAVEAAIARHLG